MFVTPLVCAGGKGSSMKWLLRLLASVLNQRGELEHEVNKWHA